MNPVDTTGRMIVIGDIVTADRHPIDHTVRSGIVHEISTCGSVVTFIEASMTRHDPLFGHWYSWPADATACTVVGHFEIEAFFATTNLQGIQ